MLGSYKDAEKFKALQRSIDPQELFAKNAGGFKYTQTPDAIDYSPWRGTKV